MGHVFFNVRECSGTGSFPNLQGKISSSSLLQLLCASYQGELREKFHNVIPTQIHRVKKIMEKDSNTEYLTNHTDYLTYRMYDLYRDCLYI